MWRESLVLMTVAIPNVHRVDLLPLVSGNSQLKIVYMYCYLYKRKLRLLVRPISVWFKPTADSAPQLNEYAPILVIFTRKTERKKNIVDVHVHVTKH